MTPSQPTSTDLRHYFKVFWRWKLIFLATVVVLPVGAYLLSKSNSKIYAASILMQVQAVPDIALLGAPSVAAPNEQVLESAARLVRTRAVAGEVAKRLDPPGNPRSLLSAVSVTPDVKAGFLTLTGSAASPQRAADVANAFGEVIVDRRRRGAIARFNNAINQLQSQLDAFPASDRLGRRQLSEELQRLRALKAAQDAHAQVIESAVPSSAPVSPRPVRTAVLAFMAALLLGIGLVFLAENIDRRIRNIGELEEMTGLPMLAVVPRAAFSEPVGTRAHEEQFQMLRASLTYFNIDRVVSTVMVTSPLQGDGKTTVATNLAHAFAKAGKDVILVDADLRRPRIAARLGIEPGAGLGAVLVGEQKLGDVLVDSPIKSVTGAGRLRVLPAGPMPPNPSELLASERLRNVMTELKKSSEIVVIDTSPVVTVSDAIPLVDQVAGIVVVARLNSTTRDALGRLQRVLAAAHGQILGVVASDATGTMIYGYGYYSGYSDEPKAGRRLRFGRARDARNGRRNGRPANEPDRGVAEPTSREQSA